MTDTVANDNMLPQRMLTIKEVASILNVHSGTVRRWEKRGLLKSYAIGLHHNLRFKQEDVLDFLDKCQEESVNRVSLSGGLDKGRQNIKLERRGVR